MKQWMLLMLLLVLLPAMTSADGNSEFRIISAHSFDVELEGFGQVRFVALANALQCRFELRNADDQIYLFPAPYSNNWACWEITAVAFRDLNKDGLKDIAVLAEAMTGIGPQGAQPFQANTIYYNTGNKAFRTYEEVNEFASRSKTFAGLRKQLAGSSFADIVAR